MPSKKRTRTYVIREIAGNWRLFSDGTELRVVPDEYWDLLAIARSKAALDIADGFEVEVYTQMSDNSLWLDWPENKA